MPARKILLILAWICPAFCLGQNLPVNPSLLKGGWPARWITCPGLSAREYGVAHFRRTITLARVPEHFIIHVTADNRYILFVNGHLMGRGPARGDLYNWNFETYDIGPWLVAGPNTLAAQVWNLGVLAPVAQISARTGFLVQGDGHAEQSVNTGPDWKAYQDPAYQPCATDLGREMQTYIVTGPGDEVNAAAYPWGWQQPGFNDNNWQQAADVPAGAVPEGYGSDNVWTLVPSPIPQMTRDTQRLSCVRRSSRMVSDTFTLGSRPLVIPAHDSVTILLDQGFETVTYPHLVVSEGRGSRVRMTYAEALFDSQGQKGNRDSIEGKTIRGLYDQFLPDGGAGRLFSPLWVRTYRYLQLNIRTGDEPLKIDDLYGIYTGYPFQRKASFLSNDSSLSSIWTVAWRTARLCAGETYFDCPYYEQLQYEADTRIQALISLYNSGDDRLMRKAIHDFNDSRVPSGLTQGRFPSNRIQVIPPFSLLWISMLHDYWMNRTDDAFLSNYLEAMQGILGWYKAHLDTSLEMLGPMDWWNFTDWNTAFPDGVSDGADHGHSAVVTLQLAYTLRQASDLLNYFHRNGEAQADLSLAERLARSVYIHCFDRSRMEMANTPEKTAFSQHASILALLAGAIPAGEEKRVMDRIISDSTLSQATFYFRFYLARALVSSGEADRYYSQLGPWRDMIARGLTTFAENPEPTRSDCHGWSASPAYDFLATICGIMPSAPGFKSVRIAPAMGILRSVRATMPHPWGEIGVDLDRVGAYGIHARITLPGHLAGTFVWNGKTLPLHPGTQDIRL